MVGSGIGELTTQLSERVSVPRAGRLLALRRAAWPLRCGLVRSRRFTDALSELARIESELVPLAGQLVDVIYALVPHATDAHRRRLLEIKRAAFNRQPLPEHCRHLAPLGPDLCRYQELVLRKQQLLTQDREVVLDELRQALTERIGATDFRLALADSSPALSAALRRRETTGAPFSMRDCRGLYAYVCRFTAKANPLHLFTHLIPGAWMGEVAANRADSSGRCEVVFSVDAILSIERKLLERAMDARRVRLALRPLFRKDGRWQVLVERKEGWCSAFLPDLSVLGHLRALYDQRRDSGGAPDFTRTELEHALIDRTAATGHSGVETAIDRLLAFGVLMPYVIEDMRAPAQGLRGVDPASERVVDCLDRWHLARVDVPQLPALDRELAAIREECPDACPDGLRYYVNSYADDNLNDAEQAAAELFETLRELRPLLTAESNFSPHRRVIHRFFADELQEGTGRPYLELLAIFLRRRVEILDRLKWTFHAPDYEALKRRCRALQGQLDQTDVRHLAAACGSPPDTPVCCVGPFDFEKRRFFLSNIFAGEHVSVCRYLLGRRQQPVAEQRRDAALDVELAIPPENNLNFVVRRFDVGCGFESRWAHGYREWLEPSEIEVRLEGGRPRYVHARTGRHLRFRYTGLLQAQFLRAEYQLLLADHADSYRNPFASDAPARSATDEEYRPGLFFGPVCLRRESWLVPADTLRHLLASRDIVTATVALHRFVYERLAPCDLWFFRLLSPTAHARKPRLLDVASPLSVMVLRHALADRAAHIALSPMEPGPEGLWQAGGEGYVAELMVEV
ncbi:MAG: hypothetical protein DMF86_14620 [Acidobacteria bacterium]|nr:MAG: hypothetical protein DMF86_14620 [Acidobacteriota bacterium]